MVQEGEKEHGAGAIPVLVFLMLRDYRELNHEA